MLEGPWGPIELWEAFGPTYPCIPRERIGDVLDGGKWCALSRASLRPMVVRKFKTQRPWEDLCCSHGPSTDARLTTTGSCVNVHGLPWPGGTSTASLSGPGRIART